MEREVFCWRYCHSVKAAPTPEHWSVEEETRIAIRCTVGSNAFLLPWRYCVVTLVLCLWCCRMQKATLHILMSQLVRRSLDLQQALVVLTWCVKIQATPSYILVIQEVSSLVLFLWNKDSLYLSLSCSFPPSVSFSSSSFAADSFSLSFPLFVSLICWQWNLSSVIFRNSNPLVSKHQ